MYIRSIIGPEGYLPAIKLGTVFTITPLTGINYDFLQCSVHIDLYRIF